MHVHRRIGIANPFFCWSIKAFILNLYGVGLVLHESVGAGTKFVCIGVFISLLYKALQMVRGGSKRLITE